MFCICDNITNNILKKNFQYSTYLFVHKTRHSLYTSTTGKTPYGWFCNPLHAVTKDLSVTFCTSFPESFSSFTTSRHDSVDALCFAANTHNPLFKTGCTLQQVSPTLQAWKAPGRPQIDCWVCNKYYVGVITRGWYQTLVSIPGMGFLVWDSWYGIIKPRPYCKFNPMRIHNILSQWVSVSQWWRKGLLQSTSWQQWSTSTEGKDYKLFDGKIIF